MFTCVIHMVKPYLLCPRNTHERYAVGELSRYQLTGENVLILSAKNNMTVKTEAQRKDALLHWEDRFFTMNNLLKATQEFCLLLKLATLVCLKKADLKTSISSLTGETKPKTKVKFSEI